MSKWPKGASKKFNTAVRAALLPVFEREGFLKMPLPASDGEWNQMAYDTDLYRPLGSDVDLVSIMVMASGRCCAKVYAVRATGFDGQKGSLHTTLAYPDARFHLERPFRWNGFFRGGTAEFYLGPPWPTDVQGAIDHQVSLMVSRLPRLFDYLETGKRKTMFQTSCDKRWPVSKTWPP